MPLQTDLDLTYMACASAHASLSKAVRKKVGACIVTKSGVIIPGYNGTPQGTCNSCEAEHDGSLTTLPTVIHAELNCIIKAAAEGVSVTGGVLYVTLAPCLSCSALIAQSQISRVVYAEDYRDCSGTQYLSANNIDVVKLGG